jgi:hypothetical protein
VRPKAVYVGAVGARFERESRPDGSGRGQMEWQEIAITKQQNTPGKRTSVKVNINSGLDNALLIYGRHLRCIGLVH